MNVQPSCAGVRARLTWEDGQVSLGERLDGDDARALADHVAACPSCAVLRARLELVVPALRMRSGPALDEIGRAAGWRALGPAVDELAAAYRSPGGAARPRLGGRARRPVGALPYLVAAAAGALLVAGLSWRGGGGVDASPDDDLAARPDGVTAPGGDLVGVAPDAGAVIEPAPLLLRPYGGDPTSHLEAGRAATRRAALPFGELALVGPGAVETRAAPGVALLLSGGTLLLQIDPDPGRPPIAILTASARIEVVGTVFLVRDDGDGTFVAVTRGVVRVRHDQGEAVELHAGESWSKGGVRKLSAMALFLKKMVRSGFS